MSYAIKILGPADTDAVEAALWYDAQSPGLGAEFMAEVNAAGNGWRTTLKSTASALLTFGAHR